MGFKLAIADTVGVKIEGKQQDKDGNVCPVKFVLYCERLPMKELLKQQGDGGSTIYTDFVTKVAQGWKDQQLVLGDDGQPAPFSPEALAMLLDVTGMAALCFHSYFQQAGVTAKN